MTRMFDITHITKSQSNTNEDSTNNEDIIQNKQEGKINENTKGTNNSGESKLGQQLSNKKILEEEKGTQGGRG